MVSGFDPLTTDDPILNDIYSSSEDLFETGEVQFSEGIERFLKTWHGVELADVVPVTKSEKQFRYRVKLVWYLTPEETTAPTKYTGSLDLPVSVEENGDAEKYQKAVKGNQNLKAKLNTVLGTLGILPKGAVWSKNVDDSETYDRLVALLKAGIGRRGSIKISRQRRLDKDSGKWVDTDFTQFEGVAGK